VAADNGRMGHLYTTEKWDAMKWRSTMNALNGHYLPIIIGLPQERESTRVQLILDSWAAVAERLTWASDRDCVAVYGKYNSAYHPTGYAWMFMDRKTYQEWLEYREQFLYHLGIFLDSRR
jgi:hypothetical protein